MIIYILYKYIDIVTLAASSLIKYDYMSESTIYYLEYRPPTYLPLSLRTYMIRF